VAWQVGKAKAKRPLLQSSRWNVSKVAKRNLLRLFPMRLLQRAAVAAWQDRGEAAMASGLAYC